MEGAATDNRLRPITVDRMQRTVRMAGIGATLLAVAPLAAGCGSGTGSHAAGTGPAPHTTTAGAARPVAATPAPAHLTATTEPWHLPAPVSRPVVLPDPAGFLILGGLASGDVSTDRIVQVDPATGSGQQVGNLGLAVHDSAGAVLGARYYVFAGGSYSTVSNVQAWAAGTATTVAHLPQARSDLTTVSSGGTAWIVGGFDGSNMDPQVLATTDGVTFRPVATLPVPVRYAAATYAGGYLWVFGGVTSTDEGGASQTDVIQRVDPATGQAAVVGHLSAPMGHATAVTLGGSVFLLGGRSGTTPSAAIWRLDPANASLTPAGTLPQALSDAGSVVEGGVAYLVGGEVSGPAQPLDTVTTLRPTA